MFLNDLAWSLMSLNELGCSLMSLDGLRFSCMVYNNLERSWLVLGSLWFILNGRGWSRMALIERSGMVLKDLHCCCIFLSNLQWSSKDVEIYQWSRMPLDDFEWYAPWKALNDLEGSWRIMDALKCSWTLLNFHWMSSNDHEGLLVTLNVLKWLRIILNNLEYGLGLF